MSSNYANVENLGLGKKQARFEDKGSDFDYNDLIFTVEKNDCQSLNVTLTAIDAGWHHQIKVGLIYDGETKKDILLWSDSHLALNSSRVVSLADYPDICLAEVAPNSVILFEKDLEYGQTSDDIKRLQIFLNSNQDTQLAKSGPGSPRGETTFFGSLTKVAVIKFQEKYAKDILAPLKLTKGTGFVGKTTRAKLNELVIRN